MSKKEENSEEKGKKKKNKKDEDKKETYVKVEAPKSKLITAFVMLAGSLFVAIYTYLQHYEIAIWLRTLFLSLIIFLIAGLLLEWLVSHFSGLINDRDAAILTQEQAIVAREADALAALEAEEEARRLAEEQAASEEGVESNNNPDVYEDFGESDEFGGIDDADEF